MKYYNLGYTAALQQKANPTIPNRTYPKRDTHTEAEEQEYLQGYYACLNNEIRVN